MVDETALSHSINNERPPAEITSGGLRLSVRTPANEYISAFFIGSFFAAFLLYLEFDVWAYVMLTFAWMIVPALALSDKVVFDGRRITRTGLLHRFARTLIGKRRSLKLKDIEQITTSSLRSARNGSKIRMRYRTAIRGRGIAIVVASGSGQYRELMGAILSSVSDDVLDLRSAELRDYLADPKEVAMKASFARIPRTDFLKARFDEAFKQKRWRSGKAIDDGLEAGERVAYLHRLGNELKVAGCFYQAHEAFRRALFIEPKNASVIFDLGRCLNVIAAIKRDKRLQRRSIAALRLAENRASNDADLLTRLGEMYFHVGEWRRSAAVFVKTLDSGKAFKARHGRAELALHDGKLAHVVNEFAAAYSAAKTAALRRYARKESEYFRNLSNDEEYLELEVGRVNLLGSITNARRTCLRIASFAMIPLMIGVIGDDKLLTDIGWAAAIVSLAVWSIASVAAKFFTDRIPYDIAVADE
ncbi:MAG: hypothetical protein IT172_09475 [Acidobacteria bacterium]|nr:hypothetical protein [Acidobacteriota bacterium]